MTDDMAADAPAVNRIIPQNLTANAAYNVAGNPPSTRPESGVANCFPGLDYDHRNLDRRFFPGLLVTYIVEDEEPANKPGIRVEAVVTDDVALQSPPERYRKLADQLAADLAHLPAGFPTDKDWFIVAVEQSGVRIAMIDETGHPLDGMIAWRLIRGLRPAEVSLTISKDPAAATAAAATPGQTRSATTIQLTGWRRDFTDAQTGVIDSVYQPGELTQSLCSPWMHDFRDCSCTYWASNRPDIVFPAIPAGQATQPSGLPTDPSLQIPLNWLRDPDSPDADIPALPTQQANRPFEVSYYQINQRWQDLPIVLEGRESDGFYVARRASRDQAVPLGSTDELYARIKELAALEHLVALLYLYALFSVIEPAAGQPASLAQDVAFTRSILLEVAIGEMQHLRAANLLLWGLAEHTGRPPEPYVIPPATTLPVDGRPQPMPAVLAPLTLDTVKAFIDIERSSGFIDGQYARVTATLKQPAYPPHLFELSSTIADEGEQHFLDFSDIYRVLQPYGTDNPAYLRPLRLGNRSDVGVPEALQTYQRMVDLLTKGYRRENVANQQSLATARNLMFVLQDQAEALARNGIGIPFLAPRQ